jgi:hypothetical protein
MVTFNNSLSEDYSAFLIPLALQNPMLLYAILSRTTMEFRGGDFRLLNEAIKSGTVVRQDKTNYDFLHFKHQAIRHLNEQLRSPNLGGINSTTFYTIAFMLRLEASLNFLVPVRRSLMSRKSI